MAKIKAKIIGNQVWMTENLTAEQFQSVTRSRIKKSNGNWEDFVPTCCTYESSLPKKKKNYLFNRSAADDLFLGRHINRWRLPATRDLDVLFQSIDGRSRVDMPYDEVAVALRGTYGWLKNGTNKIGFNALPNPSRYNAGELTESRHGLWWYYDEQINSLRGIGIIYDLDVIAISDSNHPQNGFAIRLVMDLQEPRVEEGIEYV